jgi:DNA-binding protein HU-beta
MNKADIVKFVAKTLKSSAAQAEESINAVLAGVEKGLKSDGEVSLVGYVTFKTAKRAARTGRNPQTGASIKIPARTVVKAKIGSKLKDAVA